MMLKNKKYFKKDFWAPPLNFDKNLRKRFDLQNKIYVHDVTLRDGEQTPGVAFSTEEKVLVAHELDKLGVNSIELGLPVVPKDFKAMEILVREKSIKAKLTCLVRARKDDIDAAVKTGIKAVILEHTVNTVACDLAYGMTEKDLIKKNIEMIKYAKERGLWVNWMGWDAFRSEPAQIERIFKAVVYGADPEAVTIADTFGMLHPLATFDFFKKMRKWFPEKLLDLHAHNDMGMATANAVCAITAGANGVHTAVNGLGERAGNISLEEVAATLDGCFNITVLKDLSRISRVSKLLVQLSKIKVASNKPIVGDGLFIVESGLIMHIFLKAQQKKFPMTIMQPFLPSKVGQNDIKYVVGKGAGKATVEHFTSKYGIKLSDEKIFKLIELIKDEATLRKSYLSVDEFLEIVKKVR